MKPDNIVLFGGSFNPPHFGHFRMIIEVLEQFKPNSFFVIPTSKPPHKQAKALLPFELRSKMLANSLETMNLKNKVKISSIENDYNRFSYTVDTLKEFKKIYSSSQLNFVLGAEDLETLPSWFKWEEILGLSNLILLPKKNISENCVEQSICKIWNNYKKHCKNGLTYFELDNSSKIFYLPKACIQISSTLIREKWFLNKSLHGLVPYEVIKILDENSGIVSATWENNTNRERT